MHWSITPQARKNQISSNKYADAGASAIVRLPLDSKTQLNKITVNTFRCKFNKSSKMTKHVNHMNVEGIAEIQTENSKRQGSYRVIKSDKNQEECWHQVPSPSANWNMHHRSSRSGAWTNTISETWLEPKRTCCQASARAWAGSCEVCRSSSLQEHRQAPSLQRAGSSLHPIGRCSLRHHWHNARHQDCSQELLTPQYASRGVF